MNLGILINVREFIRKFGLDEILSNSSDSDSDSDDYESSDKRKSNFNSIIKRLSVSPKVKSLLDNIPSSDNDESESDTDTDIKMYNDGNVINGDGEDDNEDDNENQDKKENKKGKKKGLSKSNSNNNSSANIKDKSSSKPNTTRDKKSANKNKKRKKYIIIIINSVEYDEVGCQTEPIEGQPLTSIYTNNDVKDDITKNKRKKTDMSDVNTVSLFYTLPLPWSSYMKKRVYFKNNIIE